MKTRRMGLTAITVLSFQLLKKVFYDAGLRAEDMNDMELKEYDLNGFRT